MVTVGGVPDPTGVFVLEGIGVFVGKGAMVTVGGVPDPTAVLVLEGIGVIVGKGAMVTVGGISVKVAVGMCICRTKGKYTL
jgi:hypothetical protein